MLPKVLGGVLGVAGECDYIDSPRALGCFTCGGRVEMELGKGTVMKRKGSHRNKYVSTLKVTV